MVHDDGPVGLDACGSSSTMSGWSSDAGIALAATLAGRLGIEALVDAVCAVASGPAGRGERGPQGDDAGATRWCSAPTAIDDCDVLRAGRTRRLLGRLAAGAVDAGDVPARVHVRACAPARPGARPRRSRARGRRARARRRAAGDRRRQLRRRGARLRQAGRRLRLHPQARLPPDPRDAARTPARCCTSACARGRRTPHAGCCASSTS